MKTREALVPVGETKTVKKFDCGYTEDGMVILLELNDEAYVFTWRQMDMIMDKLVPTLEAARIARGS